MTPRAVVFDIGGVLVDWQPHCAWEDVFETRAQIDAFLVRVDFAARNPRGDRGETFADMAAELADAADARLLAEYPARFAATVRHAVAGTWDVVDALRARNVPLHAITNWSAETFATGVAAHPRLGEVFGVTVVSGREGVTKPDARIFEILCERAGLAPGACVFVDDSAANVDGACAAGMDAIRFTGAEALAGALRDRGLL